MYLQVGFEGVADAGDVEEARGHVFLTVRGWAEARFERGGWMGGFERGRGGRWGRRRRPHLIFWGAAVRRGLGACFVCLPAWGGWVWWVEIECVAMRACCKSTNLLPFVPCTFYTPFPTHFQPNSHGQTTQKTCKEKVACASKCACLRLVSCVLAWLLLCSWIPPPLPLLGLSFLLLFLFLLSMSSMPSVQGDCSRIYLQVLYLLCSSPLLPIYSSLYIHTSPPPLSFT